MPRGLGSLDMMAIASRCCVDDAHSAAVGCHEDHMHGLTASTLLHRKLGAAMRSPLACSVVEHATQRHRHGVAFLGVAPPAMVPQVPMAMPGMSAPPAAMPGMAPTAAMPGMAPSPAMAQNGFPQVAPASPIGATPGAAPMGQAPMQPHGGNLGAPQQPGHMAQPEEDPSRWDEFRAKKDELKHENAEEAANDGTNVGGAGPGAQRAAMIMGVGVPLVMLLCVGTFVQMQMTKRPQIDDLGGDSEEALEDSDLEDLKSSS
mmetsp:Transcript_37033/g.85497  ORF Transcript_37033/g.85497 Transcript_37033/m.85497 type:complete len:260 (+) Transcript_37033:83-862(+)